MTGDAEAPRMGETMAVHEENVRSPLQPLKSASQDGHLPEGEETGDVREGERLLDNVLLDEVQIRIGEENDGATSGGRLSAVGTVREGDVGASYIADVLGVPLSHNLRGETGLDGCRLGVGDLPGVEITELHGLIVAPPKRGSER